MQYYSSKTVNLHAIERVDTAIISDESVITNQFHGSNMQVANLVWQRRYKLLQLFQAHLEIAWEFVGVLDQTYTFGRRSLQSHITRLEEALSLNLIAD